MSEIQFEEDRLARYEPRIQPPKGITGAIINMGIAKNPKQANLVMLVVIAILIVIIIISVGSLKTDTVVVEPEIFKLN